jgi:hydrogenase maturation protease
MNGSLSESTVVIGCGNPDRRDDGAGLEVVRRLRGAVADSIQLCEQRGEATGLMAAWEGAEHALVVDATASGASPGLVRRFQVQEHSLAADVRRRSTHDFGLSEAIELSRRLGTLPHRLVVYAIEGEDFGHGRGLSPPVVRAVETVAREILAELERRGSCPTSRAGCGR